MRLALAVPVHRGVRYLPALFAALREQSRRPDEIWIAETEPSRETRELARAEGARYLEVAADDYDHAGTRSLLARSVSADLLVLLSQDARPLGPAALARLVAPLEADPAVAACIGRQVAPPRAHPFTRLKREFLYPADTRRQGHADRRRLGFRTAFFSNAFAAWRLSALEQVGHFGETRLMCEDVATAAALLSAGHDLVYVGEAAAEHDSALGLAGELRRYFDIGACHAHDPWIEDAFGPPRREGLRYVRFGAAQLLRSGQARLLPLFLGWSAAKWLAFGLGRHHRALPRGWARSLSSFPEWWQRHPAGLPPRPGPHHVRPD